MVLKSYKTWTPKEEDLLLTMYQNGTTLQEIAGVLKRTRDSVAWRVRHPPVQAENEGWLASPETSALLGCHRVSVFRMWKAGVFGAHAANKDNRFFRIHRSELVAWLESPLGYGYRHNLIHDQELREIKLDAERAQHAVLWTVREWGRWKNFTRPGVFYAISRTERRHTVRSIGTTQPQLYIVENTRGAGEWNRVFSEWKRVYCELGGRYGWGRPGELYEKPRPGASPGDARPAGASRDQHLRHQSRRTA